MSKSVQNEILSALDCIIGILAWQTGWKLFAAVAFTKALFDTVFAICYAKIEARKREEDAR